MAQITTSDSLNLNYLGTLSGISFCFCFLFTLVMVCLPADFHFFSSFLFVCSTSKLLLSLFVLEWRVRFKPWPGEGALGVSESNLAPFFKHDKSTSLCATNMSVKPANYRCHGLRQAHSSIQSSLCPLTFLYFVCVRILFGGMTVYMMVIGIFLTFTRCPKCAWAECMCVCMYVCPYIIWMSVCVYVHMYCMYISVHVFYTYVHSHSGNLMPPYVLFLWDESQSAKPSD